MRVHVLGLLSPLVSGGKGALSAPPSSLAAASFQPQPTLLGGGRSPSSTWSLGLCLDCKIPETYVQFYWPRRALRGGSQTLTSPCPMRRLDLMFELIHSQSLNCNCNRMATAGRILSMFKAQFKGHFLPKVVPDCPCSKCPLSWHLSYSLLGQ